MSERKPYYEIAEIMDGNDPLAKLRQKFDVPSDVIYLDGNSLGAMPSTVPGRIYKTAEKEWGDDLVTSWNKADWVNLPQKVGERIAPIIGAEAETVVVTDSTSVNAFKVLASSLLLNKDRRKIVSEKGNFPTDLYMVQALIAFLGMDHELVTVESDAELMNAIDDQTAVVFVTQVDYRTGRRLDMKAVTAHAHRNGALTIWDLAHSAGAFPVDLKDCNVDFAIGCGYKYLNGGPGAPAFIYVRPELQTKAIQPLSGWFAHETPFAFDPEFRPAESIKRYLTGTPPVLSMVALDEALKVWDDVDLNLIQAKSVGLSQLFIRVVQDLCEDDDLKLASPPSPMERGSQVTFSFKQDGYAVIQALIALGIIGDFRAPNMLRFGFAPLYNTYKDVVTAAEKLVEIVHDRSWDKSEFTTRKAVT